MLLESLPLHLGKEIIRFSLPATDGKGYGPIDFTDKEILVLIFMCNHCPYIQATIDRMIAIQKDYAEKGVQLLGINANDAEAYPDDSFEAMQVWAKEKGLNFPYLHDESQEVAKAYQAQCTPDIYVFDQKRALRYHGRIDDNWPVRTDVHPGGKDESAITKKDLREALDAILAHEPVSLDQKPSMGCSIKWKK